MDTQYTGVLTKVTDKAHAIKLLDEIITLGYKLLEQLDNIGAQAEKLNR